MSQPPSSNTFAIRERSAQKKTPYYTENDNNYINDINKNRKASPAHCARPKRQVDREMHAQNSKLEAKAKALEAQLQQAYRKDFDSIHAQRKLREENRALLSRNSEKDTELAAATKSSQQVEDQLKAELAMNEHWKDEAASLGISNQQLKEQLKVEVAVAAKCNQQLELHSAELAVAAESNQQLEEQKADLALAAKTNQQLEAQLKVELQGRAEDQFQLQQLRDQVTQLEKEKLEICWSCELGMGVQTALSASAMTSILTNGTVPIEDEMHSYGTADESMVDVCEYTESILLPTLSEVYTQDGYCRPADMMAC
jgi:hypothetical protein